MEVDNNSEKVAILDAGAQYGKVLKLFLRILFAGRIANIFLVKLLIGTNNLSLNRSLIEE